jgi:hypothetical protein
MLEPMEDFVKFLKWLFKRPEPTVTMDTANFWSLRDAKARGWEN